ncbi:transcription elongation factor GreA [Criibacterium bergeronii]|uniref:Transcription elongation factor GreA n=1 Tax=Criibacterium bergeronii TaxID=1871336 RepID=A0A371IJ38_9FIRM|nr:transcription elongation factor GreA [Criibacterium bergeronii]MBS6062258.1 transcription elongation factor GreA [Peptostreptococcaceae bacterium]RDY20496.1 transcription elongation factor GreA [Criibacterium bergeronii]
MEESIIVTREGYEKMQNELEELKTVKRQEVSEKLKVARSFGDLSENAEYDAAKEEQAQLEERIAKLENNLRIAEVVSEQDMKQNIVNIGSTVKFSVKYPDGESEEKTVVIVGRTESNLAEGKMSNESPIGKALMGAKKGQKVDVQVPDGIAKVKVISTKF